MAGLLDANVYQTRPKNLEVFDEYQDKTQYTPTYPSIERASSRGSFSSFEEVDLPASGSVSVRTNSSLGRRLDSYSGHSVSSAHARSQKRPIPDMNSLPDMFGPESTKSLIDSIFNPSTEAAEFDEFDDLELPLHNPFVQLISTSPQSSSSSHYSRRLGHEKENRATQDDTSSLKTDSLRSQNISINSSSSSTSPHHQIRANRKRPPPSRSGTGRSTYYGDVESVVGVSH